MVRQRACEICKCGCSQRKPSLTSGVKPCMSTEYAIKYRPYPIEMRQSCKPQPHAVERDVPLEDETTHRADYISHPRERPHKRIPDAYKKPPGEIDLLSSYNQYYTEKPLDPAKPVKHDAGRPVPAMFEGQPMYRSDYRQWDTFRPKKYGPESTWVPPKDRFEAQSTTQHDYRHYNEPPRRSMKPVDTAALSDAPFDGSTCYRQEYVHHPRVPAKCCESCLRF